jgi:hypothetical protein
MQTESLSSSLDPNVEAVRLKLKQRAEVGLAKYKTDTTRKDIDLIGWLQHLQDELMDASVYVQRLIIEASKAQSSRPR